MPERPVLLFDGTCGFCARCAGLAQKLTTDALVTPWQQADLAALGTTAQRADHELLWVAPSGRVYGGAQAVAGLLISCGLPWAVAGHVLRLPPFRWLAAGLYRVIATNRHRMPGGTPACALPPRQPPTEP